MAVEALNADLKEINDDGNLNKDNETVFRIQKNLKVISLNHEDLNINKKDLISLVPGLLMMSCSKNKQLRSVLIPHFTILKDIIRNSKDCTNLDWMSILNQDFITRLTQKLICLVEEGSEEWIEPWLLVVETMVTTMVSEDRVISGTVMNILLRVAEKAFKVAKQKPIHLETVFKTWKRFIDIFAGFKKVLNTKKILGLLLVPLTSVMPESGDKHKLETWYHLVEAIGSHSDMAAEVIVGHFLQFLVQNERMFIAFKENIIFYLSTMTRNKFIKSHCFRHIIACLKLCIKHKAPVNSIVLTYSSLAESPRIQEHSEEHYSLLLSTLQGCESQEVGLRISMCKVALEHNLFHFKPPHMESLNALLEKMFPDLMVSHDFKTDVFYPLTSEIHNIACLIANEKSEKNNYDNILVPWYCLIKSFFTYLKDSSAAFKDNAIDNKILKMLLIIPLYIPFKSWNTKRYVDEVTEIIRFIRNNCDEIVQSDLIVQLEEGVKTAKMDIPSCLHFANNLEQTCQLVAFLVTVSKEIVGAQPEQVVLFLSLLESATAKETIGMKTNFKAPLTCLLKVCPSYLPPYDHKVKALASKLLRRFSSLEKEVSKNNSDIEERKGVRSPLMAHSNFLHRLSKAESKKNNKISMSAMFPNAANVTAEDKADGTVSNKENKQNLTRSPSLKTTDEPVKPTKTTNVFLSDSEGSELMTNFKVTTDFHRVPTPPKVDSPTTPQRSSLPSKVMSPSTFREALAQSPIQTSVSPKEVKKVSPFKRVCKSESPSCKSPNVTPSRSKKPPSYFDDSLDSQEFVFVPPKQKERLLTAHQKEVLKERSIDIPALYQDLSQDTQELHSQDNSSSSLALTSENDSKKNSTDDIHESTSGELKKSDTDSPLKCKILSPKKSDLEKVETNESLQSHTEENLFNVDNSSNMKTPLSVRRLNFEGVCQISAPISPGKSDDNIRRSSRKSTSKYKQLQSNENQVTPNENKKRKNSIKVDSKDEKNNDEKCEKDEPSTEISKIEKSVVSNQNKNVVQARGKRKISQASDSNISGTNKENDSDSHKDGVKNKKKITARNLTDQTVQSNTEKKKIKSNSPKLNGFENETEKTGSKDVENIIKQCENCGEVSSLAVDVNGTTVQPIKHKKGCPTCVVKKRKVVKTDNDEIVKKERNIKNKVMVDKMVPEVNRKSAVSNSNQITKVFKKQNKMNQNRIKKLKKKVKFSKIISDADSEVLSENLLNGSIQNDCIDDSIIEVKPDSTAKEDISGTITEGEQLNNKVTEEVPPESEMKNVPAKIRKRKSKATKFSPELMRKRFSLSRSPKKPKAAKSLLSEQTNKCSEDIPLDTDTELPPSEIELQSTTTCTPEDVINTVSQPESKSIQETVTKSVSEGVTKSVLESETNIVSEVVTKPVSECMTESISETYSATSTDIIPTSILEPLIVTDPLTEIVAPQTVAESTLKETSDTDTKSEVSESDGTLPTAIKEVQSSTDTKIVKRSKRKISTSKSDDPPKKSKLVKESGPPSESIIKVTPKSKRSVNSNLDQWLLKGRISKSPEPEKGNLSPLTSSENSQVLTEAKEDETNSEIIKPMSPVANSLMDESQVVPESQSLLDDSQELIESSQETLVSELLTPIKVNKSIESSNSPAEPSEIKESLPAEVISDVILPVEIQNEPQGISPSITGGIICRRPRRAKKVKTPSDYFSLNSTETNKITPEKRKRRQTIVLPPSPSTPGENWPKGESQKWVAYCPTPPEASPSVTILKKTSAYLSPSTSPKTTPKKRVGFLDPPVTKGLLYSKESNDGEVTHAKLILDDNSAAKQTFEKEDPSESPSTEKSVRELETLPVCEEIESSFSVKCTPDAFDLGLEKVVGKANDNVACTVEILEVCPEPASDESFISVDMEFQMNLDSTVLDESILINNRTNSKKLDDSDETTDDLDKDSPNNIAQTDVNNIASCETENSIVERAKSEEESVTIAAENSVDDVILEKRMQSSIVPEGTDDVDTIPESENEPTVDKNTDVITETVFLDELHSNDVLTIPKDNNTLELDREDCTVKSEDYPDQSSDCDPNEFSNNFKMSQIPEDISPIKSDLNDFSVLEQSPSPVKNDDTSISLSTLPVEPTEEETEKELRSTDAKESVSIEQDVAPESDTKTDTLLEKIPGESENSALQNDDTVPTVLKETSSPITQDSIASCDTPFSDLRSRVELFLKGQKGNCVTPEVVQTVKDIHQLTTEFLCKLAFASLK